VAPIADAWHKLKLRIELKQSYYKRESGSITVVWIEALGDVIQNKTVGGVTGAGGEMSDRVGCTSLNTDSTQSNNGPTTWYAVATLVMRKSMRIQSECWRHANRVFLRGWFNNKRGKKWSCCCRKNPARAPLWAFSFLLFFPAEQMQKGLGVSVYIVVVVVVRAGSGASAIRMLFISWISTLLSFSLAAMNCDFFILLSLSFSGGSCGRCYSSLSLLADRRAVAETVARKMGHLLRKIEPSRARISRCFCFCSCSPRECPSVFSALCFLLSHAALLPDGVIVATYGDTDVLFCG
jgi:hypothetical protein